MSTRQGNRHPCAEKRAKGWKIVYARCSGPNNG